MNSFGADDFEHVELSTRIRAETRGYMKKKNNGWHVSNTKIIQTSRNFQRSKSVKSRDRIDWGFKGMHTIL